MIEVIVGIQDTPCNAPPWPTYSRTDLLLIVVVKCSREPLPEIFLPPPPLLARPIDTGTIRSHIVRFATILGCVLRRPSCACIASVWPRASHLQVRRGHGSSQTAGTGYASAHVRTCCVVVYAGGLSGTECAHIVDAHLTLIRQVRYSGEYAHTPWHPLGAIH